MGAFLSFPIMAIWLRRGCFVPLRSVPLRTYFGVYQEHFRSSVGAFKLNDTSWAGKLPRVSDHMWMESHALGKSARKAILGQESFLQSHVGLTTSYPMPTSETIERSVNGQPGYHEFPQVARLKPSWSTGNWVTKTHDIGKNSANFSDCNPTHKKRWVS